MEESTSKTGDAARRRGARKAPAHYVLRLYVAGLTPRSVAAIASVRQICDEHLKGRYELEVVDIHDKPSSARNEQIIATPTLIKRLPAPLRRIIGSMSDSDKLLLGLDLREKTH